MVKYNLFNVFYYQDVFLQFFFHRHISDLVMNHLQVDHFFLSKVYHSSINAIVIVVTIGNAIIIVVVTIGNAIVIVV